MNTTTSLPELSKLYYSIGEVAEMFGMKTSNLRYWEKEFAALKPKKGNSGKRKYSHDDIRVIATINHLVRERGFTIDGAKKHLSGNKTAQVNQVEVIQKLAHVKEELQKILRTMRA